MGLILVLGSCFLAGNQALYFSTLWVTNNFPNRIFFKLWGKFALYL